jgi:hypothetical protein
MNRHSLLISNVTMGLAIVATVLTLGADAPLIGVVAGLEFGGMSTAAMATYSVVALDAAVTVNSCGVTRAGCEAAVAANVMDIAGVAGVAGGAVRIMSKGVPAIMEQGPRGIRIAISSIERTQRYANGALGLSLLAGASTDYCAGLASCSG